MYCDRGLQVRDFWDGGTYSCQICTNVGKSVQAVPMCGRDSVMRARRRPGEAYERRNRHREICAAH
jgi:hypothetical protein